MAYPEASNLPFNSGVLRKLFLPAKPGEMSTDAPGYWVIVQDDNMVFYADGGKLALYEGELPPAMEGYAREMLLGTWQEKPLRLLLADRECTFPPPFVAEPLLHLFFKESIDDGLLTIAGLAQQIARWEKISAACPRCGEATEHIIGTWGKRCRECGYEHFPAIHPCVVVLVNRGDELLMVRKPEWPAGYYSLPSGFCDFGECLEGCVLREVEEETGIRVTRIRYAGSQNWPFPSQLMTAFTADYAGGHLVVETGELEDAGWFRADALPPTFSSKSIAGWLIERFVSGRTASR